MSLERSVDLRYAEPSEARPVAEPAFETPTFTISHLSADPDGYKIDTRRQLTRREGRSGEFTEEEKARLRDAVKGVEGGKGEIQFQGGPAVREARLALIEGHARNASLEKLEELEQAFEHARQDYVRGMAGKVGVRNIERDGDTLSVDVKYVPFPAYTEFARPDDSEEMRDLSRLVGVAMAVRTADGKLVVQHRAVSKQRLDIEGLTRGNRIYADIPGASVAGMLDGTMNDPDRKAGTPDRLNTDAVRAAILKETDEELGLGYNDVSKVRIVGVGQDLVQVHDEFLLLTDANVTAEELREKSRTSAHNKNLGEADFEEKYVEIPATVAAIETLLTEVRAPLPPTHAALFVAAGYSMMLKEEGLHAANDWRARMEPWAGENYRRINEEVRTHYWMHPEALQQVPERYWNKPAPLRDPEGYSPHYTPDEQGLPDFEEEMVRTGLIPDRRRHVESAYLFDVDGPITDPELKEVVEEELLDTIAEQIQLGEPVGFNTGRSTAWVMERVVPHVLERVEDKSTLSNFVVIGEMGGTWVTFDEEGNPRHGKSQQLTVPEKMHQRVQQLVDEKYSDVMFVDPDKVTMVSIEMRQGQTVDVFDMRRAELGNELQQILTETGTESIFHVDHTTIATDIQSHNAGKALGAERFVQLLKLLEIKPDQYLTFGDSVSDLKMAEELVRRYRKTLFVYVGDKEVTSGDEERFPIVPIKGYSAGTVRALRFLA